MLILVPTANAFVALLAMPEDSWFWVDVDSARPTNAKRPAEVNFIVLDALDSCCFEVEGWRNDRDIKLGWLLGPYIATYVEARSSIICPDGTHRGCPHRNPDGAHFGCPHLI